MLWLVVVAAQCPCVHALVCHIPPPQSSFAQGVLVASQGYKIAMHFNFCGLCGLDPLTPLPKIEAMVIAELPGHIEHTNGNVQEMCTM